MITKQELLNLIDEDYDELINLGEELYKHPELGFKEFTNKKIIIDKLKKYGIPVKAEYYKTGFEVSIGEGYPHIGLLAELDAIIVPKHPYANNIDKCAHACGHSIQCAIMTMSIIELLKSKIINDLKGTITLYFSPGEEFVDLDYRQSLINNGDIKYLSGKQNMLADHVFDKEDLIIHLHAMGDSEYKMNINSSLAGFIYKKFNFIGIEAHAGVAPHDGINALNMYSLFSSAIGMLRETFKEEDKVRFHGYLSNGGTTVNSIPSLVTYEAYLRCANYESLESINSKIENAAISCANALGGKCEIESINGYLPFIQDRTLNEVIHKNMLEYVNEKDIGKDEVSIASGDVGDLSCFIPTIQFGFSGTKGRIHGRDFEISDNKDAYLIPCKVVLGTVYDLLNDPKLVDNIKNNFKPTLTYDEYINYLNNKR